MQKFSQVENFLQTDHQNGCQLRFIKIAKHEIVPHEQPKWILTINVKLMLSFNSQYEGPEQVRQSIP